MIIRHAEKPSGDGLIHGVSHVGAHNKHDLCVRGWQRAGALVRFFAPLSPGGSDPLISTPRSIFASASTLASPSLRSLHTVHPLAQALGVTVEADFPEGDEDRLAKAALVSEGPVLIAWHHKRIPALARTIAGRSLACPSIWPDDRFDVVWVLDRTPNGGPWRFSQVVQRLLPHDVCDPILSLDSLGEPASETFTSGGIVSAKT